MDLSAIVRYQRREQQRCQGIPTYIYIYICYVFETNIFNLVSSLAMGVFELVHRIGNLTILHGCFVALTHMYII